MLRELKISIHTETHLNVQSLLWTRENDCIYTGYLAIKQHVISPRSVLTQNKMYQ